MTLPGAAQALFKCVQPNGRVSYQSEPCAAGTKQAPVKIEDPSPPMRTPPAKEAALEAPAAPGAQPAPSSQPTIPTETVVGILANYQACAESFPEFAKRNGAAYAGWRRRHQASLVRYEQDGDARKRVREAIESDRLAFLADGAEARTARADICERNVAPQLAN